MQKENKEFWRTPHEAKPEGRFEFYDSRSGAKGIGMCTNGQIASVHLKEGNAGWVFRDWGSITHWRPDGMVFKR